MPPNKFQQKAVVCSAVLGRPISRKWYEFTIGDPEINRYSRVYRLVIEKIDRCDWDYRLVIETVDLYEWDYRLLTEKNGSVVQKSIEYEDWRLLWLKKRLVSENDYPEIQP